MWERLDRAVATDEWLLKFPDTKVYHLDVTTSDHKPPSRRVGLHSTATFQVRADVDDG